MSKKQAEEKINELVDFINSEIKNKLGKNLEAVYLVGSYARGKVSASRPDINWLLVHKEPVEDESRWTLGEILTRAIDKFINIFVVRPELRPFKFSYPLKRGKEVFVNLSIVSDAPSPDEFKRKNSFIPEYVFEGFKSTRKLVFGRDVLKNIDFQVSKKAIQSDAIAKIASHKIQLDRIPLAYHLKRDVDLVLNESLSHGKNLLYFGVELLMSDKELKEKKFLEIFHDKNKLLKLYQRQFPEALGLAKEILEAKDHFEKWKSNSKKAKKIYLAASNLSILLFKKV
jgi:predicted nucleotidyltransferase